MLFGYELLAALALRCFNSKSDGTSDGGGFGGRCAEDFIVTRDVATDSGMGGLVVVRVRFGVDDSKLPFRGGFEEEFLYRRRRCMCEDNFVRVNVVEGVGRNLIVHLAQLVDDLVNSV